MCPELSLRTIQRLAPPEDVERLAEELRHLAGLYLERSYLLEMAVDSGERRRTSPRREQCSISG
jgi:hypothetical protein